MNKIFRQYLWIWVKSSRTAKWFHVLYIGVMLMGRVLPTIVSYTQKWFISKVEHSSAVHAVISILILYVAAKFLSSIFGYIDSYFAHRFIFSTNFAFRNHLNKKLYKSPQEDFYDPDFQDRLERAVKGQEKIPFQCFDVDGCFLSILVLAAVQLPIVWSYSPLFLIYFALDSLFSVLTTRRQAKKEFLLEQQLTRTQRRTDYFAGLFSRKASAREMRIFGAQDFFLKKWSYNYHELNEERLDMERTQQKVRAVDSMITVFMSMGLLAALFIFLMDGKIDLASFVFLYGSLPAVSAQWKELFQTSLGEIYGSYRSIAQYTEFVKEPDPDTGQGKKRTLHMDAVPGSVKFDNLRLEHVSYTYPMGKKRAVNDINLTIRRNEIVAILGYNGSGKSTLCKLMTGILQPQEGSIKLNGKELNSYDPSEVFALYGIAYQDFSRYLLTIEDNVGFGYVEKYNEKETEKTLKKANCQDLLDKLPEGKNTRIGKDFYKDGIDLSGGEWQKLALARAYMGDHEILILDEPTAAIDPVREMEMLKNFKEVLQNRTAILISHRIGFARLADRILLMEDARVVEEGSHMELLKMNGQYAKMFLAQKELYM